MQNMAEQLGRLGLISQTTVNLAQMRSTEQPELPKPQINDLDACRNMHQFNQLAKVVLINDPSLVLAVWKKAHRFKNEASKNCKHFIWCWWHVYQVWTEVPEDKMGIFLDRALKPSCPNFEIPA